MELIQSLLLYMTVAYASAAGTAAPIAEMPASTPAPVIAVVAQADPETTPGGMSVVGSMITPEPSAVSTPTPTPAPVITPNKAYPILRRGSKGEDVRKLQQRLMELGFLNGNIDGSFGSQTYSAVLAFQKANGLTRDGEAGPATLTILYESPYVVPNLAVVTPTPVPTATPMPNGLSPYPENGTADWEELHLHTILYNGGTVTVSHDDIGLPTAAPRVWLRGADLMIALDELATGCGWTLVADTGENFALQALGYELDVTISPVAASMERSPMSYCDAYTATDAGVSVALTQGDVVSENGKWYVSVDFLKKAFAGTISWDEDENTLILRITSKAAAQSAD